MKYIPIQPSFTQKFSMLFSPTKANANTISFLFHAKNPEFISRYIKENQSLSLDEKYNLYQQLFLLDPMNQSSVNEYFSFMRSYNITTYLSNISPVIHYYGPSDIANEIDQVFENMETKTLAKDFSVFLTEKNTSTRTIRENIAKALYLVGYKEMPSDPEFTFRVWQLAARYDPDLSYYAIDAASLSYSIHQNEGLVLDILTRCTTYVSAKINCEDMIDLFLNSKTLPNPGFFLEDISSMR